MQKYDSKILEQANSLQIFLQAELSRRINRNSNYSIRAYARDLEISASRLSEVLNSKRGISQKTYLNLLQKFRPTSKHQAILSDLFLLQSSKSSAIKQNAKIRLQLAQEKHRIKRLDKQTFKIISDWYHAALIELMVVKNFKNNPEWIARKLGITSLQATEAIQRLIEVGLAEESNGILKPKPEITFVNSEQRFDAVRKFHRQTLKKALISLDKDEVTEREFNSMILAIPKEYLPELKKKIQFFMQEFWQDVADKPKDEIFGLNIQFFPISKK